MTKHSGPPCSHRMMTQRLTGRTAVAALTVMTMNRVEFYDQMKHSAPGQLPNLPARVVLVYYLELAW